MADDAAEKNDASELKKVLRSVMENGAHGAAEIGTVQMRAALALAVLNEDISIAKRDALRKIINGEN